MPSPVTTGQVIPGFFGYVDYNSAGSGLAPTRRVLLIGYIGATAQRTPNVPFLPASQQEADDGCERGSDLARMYAAAISQPEAQGAEVWLLPIAVSSGNTASTYKLKVYATSIAKAGTIQLWIASQQLPAVGFTTSDTATTIGDAIAAAILAMTDLPIATATNAGGTITITYKHKGLTGEDLPVRGNVSPAATGVGVSIGQALFAVAATGAGTVRVGFGNVTVSTSISNGDTAAQIATKVAASWNADTYPLYAAVDGTTPEQVNFFLANDKDVHRMTATVITSTGTTVNLGSGATSGIGSASSLSYNGTQGVGAPSVSSAVTNLGPLGFFRSWASAFVDTSTLGTFATAIENASDGSISGQKQQTLTIVLDGASSVAGAVAPAVSPNLTTSAPHYAIGWCPENACQNYEHAARVAAARAANWLDTPQFNWNGFQLKGSARAPILQPWTKPSLDAQNTALRTYALFPLVTGQSGNLEVVKGRTTSLSNDRRLWSWSIEAQAAYHSVDLALFFQARFQGGSLLRYSTPKAAGIYDERSFESATRERMRFWEANGNFDGAELLSAAVKAKINVTNPNRVDVDYPENGVLDLDQICFSGHFMQPAA